MVFGLFLRKAQTQPDTQPTQTQPETQSPERTVSQQQLRTPSPSLSMGTTGQVDPPAAPMDVDVPSVQSTDEQLVALRALVLAMPAPALKAFVIQALEESPVEMQLLDFFKDMAAPPLMHCLRCHGDYYDVDNTPISCHIAHDDESTLVERVGGGKGYETFWQCCGKTTEGDGDQGPPDGWCYEGEHTTDIKRARFRADSTIHKDKLVSCIRRKCGVVVVEPPSSSSEDGISVTRSARSRGRQSRVFARTSPSPARSTRSRSRIGTSPARPSPKRKLSASDDEQDDASDAEKPQLKKRKRQTTAKSPPSTSTKPTSKAAAKSSSVLKPKPKSRAAKAVSQTDDADWDGGAVTETENNPPKRRGRPPASRKGKEPAVPASDRTLRARSATPARGAREPTPAREKTPRKAAVKEAATTPRVRAKKGARQVRIDDDEAVSDGESTVVVKITRTKKLDEVVESSIPGEC
ncbi:hypothetical protein BD626DRAFT_554625 [Schizophyllum amplum]|uniref:Uncharacterized protein n=1 Tax=Schizophyllum amplum TaxID=97359 RepID=A0A550CRR4_9AGAR|nr:hypothetical protein BD626DRAFT_554625 [Auriculariopsis ampla]